MENNIANKFRPKLFSEYIGQESVVNYLKSVVKTNKHPSGLLFEGLPGLGKTSIAHLYVKATLCEERKEGEYEPCGKCNSCLSDIEKEGHPNITYYRITEASAFKDTVSDLISITKASPVITHDNTRKDNHRRFIVIDEIQNSSRQSISPFLDSLEFAVEEITIILISMDLDRMDLIVREAIESRCITLSLNKLNKDIISNKLIEAYPELKKDVCDLLAYLCKGNMRQVWKYIEFFITQYKLEDLTIDIISKQLLCGLNKNKCEDLLLSLQEKSWKDSSNILKNISNNEEQIIDYFINILIDKELSLEGLEFLSALSFWLQSNYKIPILSLFKQVQGKILIIKSVEHIAEKPKSFTVNNVFAPGTEIQVTTNSVINQLSKMTGKQIQSSFRKSKWINLNEWHLLLEYYDTY